MRVAFHGYMYFVEILEDINLLIRRCRNASYKNKSNQLINLMNQQRLLLIILLGLSIQPVFSQPITNYSETAQPVWKTREFEILLPEYQVPNSLYSTIDFADARDDKTNLGYVQVGAFNQSAEVIPQSPFPLQLQKVMQAVTDQLAKDGKLLLQLRQLKFAEVTSAMGEKGYCYLRAGLFTENNAGYQQVASIDTMLVVKSMDVTKATLKGGSALITDFIASNLQKQATDQRLYTLREIVKIDSTEKRSLVLYNTEKYAEGLYYDYQSFSNQKPDENAFVEMKKNSKISCVKVLGENNEMIKLDPGEFYAVVFEGQPYVSTQYGYYPLTKSRGEFYFTGKMKANASSGDIMAAQMMFGVMGAILVSNATANYEMKLDHSNGKFIRIRQVGYEQ